MTRLQAAWTSLGEAERHVLRWSALITGVGVIFTSLGFVNKTLIADPIAKSQEQTLKLISEERAARQDGDANLQLRVQAFESGEADSISALRITRLARQVAAVQLHVVETQTQIDSILSKVLKGRRLDRSVAGP